MINKMRFKIKRGGVAHLTFPIKKKDLMNRKRVKGLWIHRQLDVKIIEAKGLECIISHEYLNCKIDDSDWFCTATIDNDQFDQVRTSTSFQTQNPHWVCVLLRKKSFISGAILSI